MHLDLLSIPQSGWKTSKRLVGEIIGCKYKTSSWHLNGFPTVVVTLGQQFNTGEESTVVICTYINLHAGTTDKKQTKHFSTQLNRFIIFD